MYKKSSITVGYAIRTAESEGKVWAMYKKSSITVGYAIRTAEVRARSVQCIKREYNCRIRNKNC